ncbi:MAG: CPBP family intramembrane glutamic endopeptidase, partial [Clostridia bacterium]
VCEELLFRGVLMSAWLRRGRKCALLFSTALFVLSHGSIEALPGEAVIGLALGLIVLASDSLIPAMAYHALHNALVLVLPGVSGGAQAALASGQTLIGFVGGGSGVWMLLMRTLAFLAVFGGLLYTIWQLRAPTKAETTDKTPLGTQTLIVLAAGIVTACCLYFINFLTLLGVL